MANPGAGSRFASVNLNKSYGQSSSSSNYGGSFSYGSGRGRSGNGGGGGGGMVVLSRPRSSQKAAGSKLSVPPPLNLPSRRKEHEKFDSLGSGNGSVGGGAAGGGARPSSSGLGWSKPSSVVTEERDDVLRLSSDSVGPGLKAVNGSSSYMPPSARYGVAGLNVSAPVSVGKTSVLRGEDFPSLRATLAAAGNGPVQKQKDTTHQKHRQGVNEEISLTDMRPQVNTQYSVGKSVGGDTMDDNLIKSRPLEQGRRQETYFPGPLPLVRLSPRSDWADDERDTSHGLMDRGRDNSFSRPETYWDRDFDFPRSNFLPQKLVPNHFDRQGQRDNDVGKGTSNEVRNADPFNRDVGVASREGRDAQSWRRPASRDEFASLEVARDKNNVGSRPTVMNRDTVQENKYIPSQFGSNLRGEHIGGPNANKDLSSRRTDSGYVQVGRQQWNNSMDSSNGPGSERREFNRYKGHALQNSMGSTSSYSAGSRGMGGSDHSFNFGRDKHSFSRGEKPYSEDPFISTDFDVQDPFSGGILGVVKRKKDANKHLDFHDPVRESFEAELERVQKMQEQDRQRVIEEQEREMEMSRREEEERQRVAREQEEHQRRLEEEAREAAWRVEQERLETIRRAEEQRLAREEEKQRLLMEEERRRQAAKQKLQELEERIARRQGEGAKEDGGADVQGDRMPVSKEDDFSAWEDGERMVERITNTASSDSSIRRPFDMGSRPMPEGSCAFVDRGKSLSSWRRDVFENGNSSSFFSSEHENGYQSPRRDAFAGGRAFPRKDLYGGSGYMPTRGYYRGGTAEPQMEDFLHARGHRWSVSGDGDPYGGNTLLEAELHESIGERFDVDWGQGRGHGYSPFSERVYPSSELEDIHTSGRSRYPARQPRALPPPSLPSVHRTSFRSESEQARSSTYQDGDIRLSQAIGSEPAAVNHQNTQEEHFDRSNGQEHFATNDEQELNRNSTPGCDSQSSLCVSSAPSSPTQLSHDDSRDSVAVSDTGEGQDVCNSEDEAVVKVEDGNGTPSSISLDDDEDWTVENNGSQQQEEYDEDVRYNEEELQDGDDDNAELNRELEGMHLERKESPHTLDNMVLGFDQGVEVGMPNDECERSPRPAENLIGPQVFGCPAEDNKSFDQNSDKQSPQVADGSQHLSHVRAEGSENVVKDHVPEPIIAPIISKSSDPSSSGDSITVTVLTPQQSVPSSAAASSKSSSQTVLPNVAGTQGATELPVKLQFGLFSGPSLIPSPVPAIQIGSIQMPLHLPPQIGPPLSHMHSPQPPLFQFGQVRYPSPISQGFSRLAPPSMSFVQPTVASHYPSGQRYGGQLYVQPIQGSSTNSSMKDDVLPFMKNSHHTQLPSPLNVFGDVELKEPNMITGQPGSNDVSHNNEADSSNAPVNQVRAESRQHTGIMGHSQNFVRNLKPSNNKTSERRAQGGPSSSHFAADVGDSSVLGPTGQGPSGNKGRRFAFTARNPGARSSSLSNGAHRADVNGYQRRRHGTQRFEFRVRQATDAKQSDPKSNHDGIGSVTQLRSGPEKEAPSNKPQPTVDSHISSSDQITTKETGSGIKEVRLARKETSTSVPDTAWLAEGSLKRNISSEDDVDVPLQSGIVRIFKQPGIEAPSDEDDFIEVRSKRQMLNDRREQREKDIKAKSSMMRKAQQKSRTASQGSATARNMGRIFASSSASGAKSIPNAVMPKQGLVNNEAFNNMVSQTLSPIGTPPINADSQAGAKSQTIKPGQASSSANEQTVGPDMTFYAQNNAFNDVHSSICSQGNSHSDRLVMTLTQTQLEEAMKPVQCDKEMVSVGDNTGTVSEVGMSSSSSSLLAKDYSVSSATSPISCLLAGEKIQFGAVTSPTILRPSTRFVSHGTRAAPTSSQLDSKTSQSMPACEKDRAHLFEKEKHTNEPCRPLEDREAEAEAAASAVAVAAISNDEVVRTPIGSSSPTISVSKGLRGMPGVQPAGSQSKREESMSVSLPTDLLVETPPMSLWPPLPSSLSSSSQVPSPFPGGPSSHFPFYDMNPMMGGPVFAIGHEESAGSHLQPQKSSAPSSGPLGTWQQCHPGVYSFYGPPGGFTPPFISPPGSMPEAQGPPPHMVVYNHFAPVGQFGQVGLSYMGSTYIPSGKQPDWKHNPASSAMGGGEGEMNSLNMVPVQRSAPNVPAQLQHVAPGSPLLSMAPPLAMFEGSPFQSTTNGSVHPHWHSIPQSMPLQQQPAGAMPYQINHGGVDHHPLTSSESSEPQASSSLEEGRSLARDTNAALTQSPDQLGSVCPSLSNGPEATAVESQKVVDGEGSRCKENSQIASSGSHKAQSAQQKNMSGRNHYSPYRRGGSQKNNSGGEWSNHKMGFHGKSHSSGGERGGFPPTKVKQIYVAKQSISGAT